MPFSNEIDSVYFQALFWVAIATLKISDVKLFNAAVNLLEIILSVQDSQEGFKRGMEEYFNTSREGPIDQIIQKLDQISGLNFKSSFSFGVASHLLKAGNSFATLTRKGVKSSESERKYFEGII
jgi:hypothetical protein